MRKVLVAIAVLVLSFGIMGFTRAEAAPTCVGLLSPVETLLSGPTMGALAPVFTVVDLIDATVLGAVGLQETIC